MNTKKAAILLTRTAIKNNIIVFDTSDYESYDEWMKRNTNNSNKLIQFYDGIYKLLTDIN